MHIFEVVGVVTAGWTSDALPILRRLFGTSIIHIFEIVGGIAAVQWMCDHPAVTIGVSTGVCATVAWGLFGSAAVGGGLFAAIMRMKDHGDTGLAAPSEGYGELHNIDGQIPKPDVWYFDDGNGQLKPAKDVPELRF